MKVKTVVKVVALGLALFGAMFPATAAKKDAKQKTLIVGTGTNMKPHCFLDENGNLVGYEIDLINAIVDRLPQYKVKFQTYDFKNILVALGAGKIDVGAHQYEWNQERAKNYLFSDIGYNNYDKYLIVLWGRTDIKTWDDLAGKNVQAGTGSATLTELQAYNASVPDNKKLNIIITTNATREQSVAALKSGAWDATIGPLTTVDTVNKDWGNVYQIVDPEHPVQHNAAYHVFNKKSSKLKAEWDAVLKKLVEEGVVSQLSIKWFGKDYTKGAPKN